MSNMSVLDLPTPILISILKLLDTKDLRSVIATCKSFRDIILNDNSVWRWIYRDKLIIRNRAQNSVSKIQSWYNLCRISQNWRNGVYRKRTILHHNINYMPWLTLHNDEVLLLSVGSELQCYPIEKNGMPNCNKLLWKLNVPKIKRYDARTNDVSRFCLKDNLVICGNRDGCVSVYEQRNIKTKPQLLYHIEDCHEDGKVEVTAVDILKSNEQYAITASSDSSKLCFWLLQESHQRQRYKRRQYKNDWNNGCIKNVTLTEDVGMRCMKLNDSQDKLAIGPDGNCKPLLLDITTGQMLLNASPPNKQAVRDVQWHNENTIASVTHSGMLQCLDIRTDNLVYNVMDPFQSKLYCLKTDGHNGIVVGTSEYSRCVLFDTRNAKHHVQMFFTQDKTSPVYCLDFDAAKLIAAADRSVAVLNFNINIATAEPRDYSQVFEVISR